MNYVPHTMQEKKEMMDFLGIESVDELFSDIPERIRLSKELSLPKPMSETHILSHMKEIAESNAHAMEYSYFLGAGCYNHFSPSAIEYLISRSEFYSSYTPYQAEMSQGLLQSIFEFQTLICELTEMDVANASMYDGATALAEAAILAVKYKKSRKIAVSDMIHPVYRNILKTYAKAFNIGVIEIGSNAGETDLGDLESKIDDSVAAVALQSPNFFGTIENLAEAGEIIHKHDSLFISSVVEPLSLGLVKPPGAMDADIVAGEGQALGNSMNFGGPHLGFMATKKEFLKKIPGRISGLTVDTHGNKGFILTLQAREQHVRRERATSNICTNQALNALAATVYLALMGKHGISKVAEICAHRARYTRSQILDIPGFSSIFSKPFFNEFAIKCPIPVVDIDRKLRDQGIIGGFDLGQYFRAYKNGMLLCVTEMNSRREIDRLLEALKGVTL